MLNVAKICHILPQVRHLLPRKKLITTVKRKKLKKVGFEFVTFCAADAHATNRLQGALGKPASGALFKPAPFIM